MNEAMTSPGYSHTTSSVGFRQSPKYPTQSKRRKALQLELRLPQGVSTRSRYCIFTAISLYYLIRVIKCKGARA